MSLKQELKDTTEKLRLLSLYQRFEHIIIMFLTALIAVIVIAAVWNLSLKILFGLVLSGSLDPSDYTIFQAVFGMIFTVIIALEFKKSLLLVAGRRSNEPGEGGEMRRHRRSCVSQEFAPRMIDSQRAS